MTPTLNTALWISRPKVIPTAKVRLFCFPYAGGGALLYRPWIEALPADIEVCSIQYPGRENRLAERPFDTLEPLVDAFIPALRPFLDDKPFAFFGYSLGTLVAFEVARRLHQSGAPLPLHLFVAARRAPHLPNREAPLQNLSDGEFMEELRRLKGTPQEVLDHAELMQFLLPLLRADFTVNETYVYQTGSPLPCAISAFGGTADEDISRDDMDAWRIHTERAFTLRMIQGDHFFIHTARMALLQAICRDLAPYL
jgi:medium-chain acyl-[acyl-carrier-protein] hydrolase